MQFHRTAKRYNTKSPSVEAFRFLLFIQKSLDLLSIYNIDSFKSQTLNTTSSIDEVLNVLFEIKEGRLDPKNSRWCKEELKDRILFDEILSKKFDRSYLGKLAGELVNESLGVNHQIELVEGIKDEISVYYWKWVQESLDKFLFQDMECDIGFLCNSFIIEVEKMGFHRASLFYRLKKIYIRISRSSVTMVEIREILIELYKDLNVQTVEMEFIFKIHTADNSIQILKDMIKTTKELPMVVGVNPRVSEFLKEDENRYFAIFKVGANEKYKRPDVIMASERFKGLLETFSSISAFYSHCPARVDSDFIFIDGKNGKVVCIDLNKSAMYHGKQAQKRSHQEIEKGSFKLINGIAGLNSKSYGRFFKLLTSHQVALSTDRPEVQLLQLWSALEQAFSIHGREKARIEHYLECVTPALVINYCTKLLNHCYDVLMIHALLPLEMRIGVINRTERAKLIAKIFFSKEYAIHKHRLMSLLGGSPLSLWTVENIIERMSSPKKIRESVQTHKKRIETQMQRIYSARNMIVHQAENLPYLNSLIENLHFYLDELVNSVANEIQDNGSEESFDGIISRLKRREEWYLKLLEDADKKPLKGLDYNKLSNYLFANPKIAE